MKKIIISFLITFTAICSYLLFIDPYTLRPLQLVPMIVTVYLFCALAIYIYTNYFYNLDSRQRMFVSVVLAFSPTILCALMTLGTLAAIDVVLAIMVPVLIAWYGVRVKRN